MPRLTGTVKFFNNAKGFGFITPDAGGNDVFVHVSAVQASDIPAIGEGDRVSFVLEDDARSGRKRAGQLAKA
jgi:CspA family cold shock protein